MEKRPTRGIARLTPIALGGIAAFALAVPSVATAAFPTGGGKIVVSDGGGVSTSVWLDGTHSQSEPDYPQMSKVDGWHASGSKLIFTDGGSAAYQVSNGSSAVTFWEEPSNELLSGAAISPDGNRVAISTGGGVMLLDGTPSPEVVYEAPAGRIAWSAQTNEGTLVWDGFGIDSDPGIPGGGDLADPISANDGNGAGIWMRVDGATPVEVVTEPSATNPSISQDGKIIAWEQDGPNGDTDVYWLDATEPSPVKHRLADSTTGSDIMPAVSPDGTRIAFVSDATGTQTLRAANLNGQPGSAVRVEPDGITGVAWQPATKVTAGAVGITGTADVGQMLSANPLTAPSGTAPFVDTYTWEACDDAPADGPDPTCAQVGFGSFYTVKEADRGKRMRLVLTTRNSAGSDKSYSARSTVVPGGTPSTPVDTTAPDPSSFTGYPQLEDPDTTPTFAWVGSEPGGKFQCQIVGGLKGIVIPPEEPTTLWEDCTSPTTTPELTEGLHRFRVRHIDDAGNVQGYDEFEWTVTAAPPAPDTTKPLQPTFTSTPEKLGNDATPTFAWTGAEAGGKFQCKIVSGRTESDYGTWTDCTTPFTTPALTEGFWTIAVRQVDDAGNIGNAQAFEYELDKTAPDEVILMETPFLNTPYPTATFKFAAPAAGNRLECRYTGPATESGPAWEPCTSPVVLPDLPNGKHKFEVREVDAAGNASTPAFWDWIVNAPVVEQPKPEVPVKPETPKAETPAVQTPAVETPKESPKPTTVVVPAPAAKPATAKAPALVATIGGTKSGAQVGANGGTSSAATIEVAKESVGVGCSITGTVLKSCKVDLYAPRAAGATARAAAADEVLVGTGTYVNAKGSSKMDVKIELNKTGKAMLRRNPDGLKVSVKITGNPVNGPALKATGVAKLVSDRASLTVGGFAVNSAVLTGKAKAQLRVLAKFGKAASVRCVGHTDGSSDDASYLKGLGADRAKAVCAYLAKHGVKASTKTLVSKADTVPASTNTTKAGRAQNRRVVVTLVR